MAQLWFAQMLSLRSVARIAWSADLLRMKPMTSVGARFGRLVIVEIVNARYALCLCDCGTAKRVHRSSLTRGKNNARSCGCILRERYERLRTELPRLCVAARAARGVPRGVSKAAEYGIWAGMRARCLNPKNTAYARYGGRGIAICERWEVFSNFLADVGPRPSKNHSIDRVDNSKGYYPDNVRWATAKEQMRNRRVNHVIEHGGLILTLAGWAERTGLKATTIIGRLGCGWPPGEAVSTPLIPPHLRPRGRGVLTKEARAGG